MRVLSALLLSALLSVTNAAAQAALQCAYDLTLRNPQDLELVVDARCEAGVQEGFAVPRSRLGDFIEILEGDAGGDRVKYRVRLAELAGKSGSPDFARRVGDMIVSPIPIWLVQPQDIDATVMLHVKAEDGLQAAINLPQKDGAYFIMPDDIPYAGYAAFGRFAREQVPEPRGRVEIVHSPGLMAMDGAELRRAVGDAAMEVARYYDRFAVPQALVVALPGAPRGGVEFGRVRGGGGATMMLRFGTEARAADLTKEWVLVHEFIHFHGPFVPRAFWLTEGMATYIEPVIRARAGWRSAEDLWREFATDMPRGLEALTEEGLDNVTRRGLYWGGALFMLLADLDIREKTQGRASLETALRAVLNAGGDATKRWTKERVFTVADEATGTGTMRRLADAYVSKPGSLDLPALWRSLGVVVEEGRVKLDDTAPRAQLRRAITAGPAGG